MSSTLVIRKFDLRALGKRFCGHIVYRDCLAVFGIDTQPFTRVELQNDGSWTPQVHLKEGSEDPDHTLRKLALILSQLRNAELMCSNSMVLYVQLNLVMNVLIP